MRGDSRLGLLILAVGIAPAVIKKSKPLARYVGGHLVKFGEYFLHDSEDPSHAPGPEATTAQTVEAPPVAEEVIEVIIIQEVAEEPEATAEQVYDTAPIAEATPEPGPEPENQIEPTPSSE